MLPWGLLSVNVVAFLILTLPPPFIGGQSPSSFDNDKTIDGDGDDTNIDGDDDDDDDKTIDGDDKTIHSWLW